MQRTQYIKVSGDGEIAKILGSKEHPAVWASISGFSVNLNEIGIEAEKFKKVLEHSAAGKPVQLFGVYVYKHQEGTDETQKIIECAGVGVPKKNKDEDLLLGTVNYSDKANVVTVFINHYSQNMHECKMIFDPTTHKKSQTVETPPIKGSHDDHPVIKEVTEMSTPTIPKKT